MGDLRGINNGLLDTYQLKSLDGLAELDVRGMNLTRNADGRISITPARESLAGIGKGSSRRFFSRFIDTVVLLHLTRM